MSAISVQINDDKLRKSILEMSPAEARAERLRYGFELTQAELEARRRRLCQKPAPKYAVGLTFIAHLKDRDGQPVIRECKVVSHQWSFSLQWGQTLFYELEGGGQVLAEQIERAMNPQVARPRYVDYCEDCE